jgi:alpha-N-arabinofuranosidase
MKYQNPIIRGVYPDPSVCKADGKFYLVNSSFQFFPGVPLFESEDLINWKQIGHCLTRPSQDALEHAGSSAGIYAPTIRYNDGRWYMTTTNTTTGKNFYVYTDDIHGEWSEPILVEQGGIDPSLYFENGKSYFISNGQADDGTWGITMCEIDITTGNKLSPGRSLWQGSGGRYLEGPHVYKIGGKYLLLAAEGGTEYGHMVTYALSDELWGQYVTAENCPVLTNRNLGGYQVQGVGHGDLLEDNNGNWWMVHLAFRQIDKWMPYHHLGRETFLTPVTFNADGTFTAGQNGTVLSAFETDRIPDSVKQDIKTFYTFENTDWDKDWCYLRNPVNNNYHLTSDSAVLTGTSVTLDTAGTPSFIGIRQTDFNADIACLLTLDAGKAGITLFMDEDHHYDIEFDRDKKTVALKLNVGDARAVPKTIPADTKTVKLVVKADNYVYHFYADCGGGLIDLGYARTKYISTEVAAGFTGVMIGLYATGEGNTAAFSAFACEYSL